MGTGTDPAAVTCPVINRPKILLASRTALYPAIFAIELNASKTCALLMRGIISIANDVVPLLANFSTTLLFCPGYTATFGSVSCFLAERMNGEQFGKHTKADHCRTLLKTIDLTNLAFKARCTDFHYNIALTPCIIYKSAIVGFRGVLRVAPKTCLLSLSSEKLRVPKV